MLKKLFDFVYIKQSQLAAIFLSLLSLLIYLQNDHPNVHALQGFVAEIVSPIKYPIIFLEEMAVTKKQNRIMSERLIHLSVEASKYNSLQEENRRLKELIGFRESSPFQLVPAQILSRNISQELNSILIDVGQKQGVKLYDPVISVDGIVGKTFSVYENSTIVELLTGPQFRISVMIKPTEATGILQWIGANQFIINDIPNTVLVE
ncbi:MAG TPA: rod shape-determining protein MreC, partial [Candidatus Marinimicrobia bacterium]|nr:rod shape-determining protein MreC [Candidatus Neomarinimicrobiota bacterium]